MKAFSDFLFTLYRESKHHTQIPAFQNWALAGMQPLLPFDAASWSYGYFDQSGPQIHSIYHYVSGQPEGVTFLNEWGRAEPTLQTLHQSGIARHQRDKGTILLSHSADCAEGQLLCTLSLEPLTGFCHVFSLFTARPAQTCLDETRLLKQSLVPHLVEAFNYVQMQRMYGSLRNRNRILAGAVANEEGVLVASDPAFIMLMRLEWPDWTGPHLPRQIMARPRIPGIIKGSRTTLQISWKEENFFLYVRPRLDVDALTPRELMVARRFGQGESYKEIAKALRLSPTTVRNHIASIYNKLKISDKTSLTSMLSLSNFVEEKSRADTQGEVENPKRFAS